MESKTSAAFERLSTILDTLREKCPWDRVQTMKSLRYLTIEEVHELSEAILMLEKNSSEQSSNPDEQSLCSLLVAQLKKELGDVAMHILFYCKIAEDDGLFSTADVYNAISDKLIQRHPFIYNPDQYGGEDWEQIKMREGRKNALEGVPSSLPTLIKSLRMQEKMHYPDTLSLSKEEFLQCCENLYEGNSNQEDVGRLLFDIVALASKCSVNADDALSQKNLAFADSVSKC